MCSPIEHLFGRATILYTNIMKKLYKSDENKVLSGVAGGVAEYYEIDPVLVRLIGIFITIVTGIFPMALMYLIAALVIPKRW